jgi:hypothetical protein
MPNYLKLLDEQFGYTGEPGNFLDHVWQILSYAEKCFVSLCKENKEFH